MTRHPARTILLATAVVGTLDIVEVCVFFWFRGVAPTRILQGIAAGVPGRTAAPEGGLQTALLGLGLHFFIALCVVVVYFLAGRKIPALHRHPIILGALYGIAVHLFMKFVVVPASALGASTAPQQWPAILNAYFAHIFCVGIPTALLTRDKAPSS